MRKSLKKQGLPDALAKRDYGKCCWGRRGLIAEGTKCILLVAGLSYFFYKSIWAVVPLSIAGILCWKRDSVKKVQKDQHKLLLQFCDMIRSVSSAMTVGYSVENAFLESYRDMLRMHGKDSMICRELEWIRRGLVMNLTLEQLLDDFGKRSRIEQIREFSAVCSITGRNGGSMTEVIRSFTELIYRQKDTREEILTQTSGRRMEQNLMNVIPFAILMYIEASNRGYFRMLYHNMTGVIVMSICLLVYMTACYLSDRILDHATAVWN
jgi:tight adherence protein B